MNATQRYARAQQETASPERLMVLLFEAALRHVRAAAAALEAGRDADANAPLARAVEIVTTLHGSLDGARAPRIAEGLASLYPFLAERLVAGNARRDAALVREAEAVLAPLADAFAQAVQRTAAERR